MLFRENEWLRRKRIIKKDLIIKKNFATIQVQSFGEEKVYTQKWVIIF